jgi:hypothetical protein
MRLHFLSTGRTAAIRQYKCCVEALHRELGVEPAARTVKLYQQMRAGQFAAGPQPPGAQSRANTPAPADWPGMVAHLQGLQETLAELQDQIQDALDIAQQMANGQQ